MLTKEAGVCGKILNTLEIISVCLQNSSANVQSHTSLLLIKQKSLLDQLDCYDEGECTLWSAVKEMPGGHRATAHCKTSWLDLCRQPSSSALRKNPAMEA